MFTLQEWSLLVMFGILACAEGKLHKPLNLKTESRNFSLFLTWLSAPENPLNVSYQVKYMLVLKKRWLKVPGCESIVTTDCDLTCVLHKNYHRLHSVKVRAVSVTQSKSEWASLQNISYMFTVVPSPPVLTISQRMDHIMINTSAPTPLCIRNILSLNLSYKLEISNKNNQAEKRKIEETSSSTIIKTNGYEGEYCVTAQTVFAANKQISQPSHSICFNVTQKDESHIMTLAWLPVIGSVIIIATLCSIIWNKIHEKVAIPKALTFSRKRCDLAVSVIPEENFYPLAINKNMDQTSSATLLLSNEDNNSINEYPLSGCGYTERKAMAGNSTGSDSHYEDSTSDEYMSSKGLPTNSSSDKSSDISCVQTSGSNTEMTLMLNKKQLNNEANEIISVDVSVDIETLVTNTVDPLLDTLCVSNCDNFGDVLLNTLTISSADKCLRNEPSEYYLTDSENEPEQLPNDYKDSDIPRSYRGSKIPQKNGSSGYEQRCYMSRT